MENNKIHPAIAAILLQNNIWVPDDESLTDAQKRKNTPRKEEGVQWWPAVLKAARKHNRADYSDRQKNRHMVSRLLRMLIKNQDSGYYYFYPEFYHNNKALCFEFFTAWQMKINATRRKKDGWCWHWVEVGNHRIKMMEIR